MSSSRRCWIWRKNLYLVDACSVGGNYTAMQTGRHDTRFKILLSYWYFQKHDIGAFLTNTFQRKPAVFADSGAFSAKSQGVSIKIDEYIKWLHRWKEHFDCYANLDVIGNHRQTMENQRIIESAGLAPLPVYHAGEPWEALSGLTERYSYIALGGLVGNAKHDRGKTVWRFCCKAFEVAKKRCVYHGFGCTSWQTMRDFPWYSVDSSSWASGFRYGQVPIWDERRGRIFLIGIGDVRKWLKNAAIVRAMGFDPRDFADRNRCDRTKLASIAAYAYILGERWLAKRHGEVHIPSIEDGNAGPMIFLADPTDKDASSAEKALGPRLYLCETDFNAELPSAVKHGEAAMLRMEMRGLQHE